MGDGPGCQVLLDCCELIVFGAQRIGGKECTEVLTFGAEATLERLFLISVTRLSDRHRLLQHNNDLIIACPLEWRRD